MIVFNGLQPVTLLRAFTCVIAAVCSSLVLLTSCAVIPDVEYTYYPSKMRGVATVTETVTCDSDSSNIVISSSAGFVPTYAADVQAGLRSVAIRRFEGTYASFADSEANFTFYDDGRLKSINQNTTGQGETIIKSLVSLGTSVGTLAAAAFATKTPCETVKAWNPTDSKALASVTLTYTAELNASSTDGFHIGSFKATGTSKAIHTALEDALTKGNFNIKNMPTYTLRIGRESSRKFFCNSIQSQQRLCQFGIANRRSP